MGRWRPQCHLKKILSNSQIWLKIRVGWGLFGSSVVGNKMLSLQAKLTIYKTLYRPILTYVHEAWTLNKRTWSGIQAAEMRFLRRIIGVTRRDRIRNEDIRKILNVEPLLWWIKKCQLK